MADSVFLIIALALALFMALASWIQERRNARRIEKLLVIMRARVDRLRSELERARLNNRAVEMRERFEETANHDPDHLAGYRALQLCWYGQDGVVWKCGCSDRQGLCSQHPECVAGRAGWNEQ